MSLKLNIAYNKTTKQLIGYSNPKKGNAIVVTAYAVDDLQKKFNKEVVKLQKENHYVKNHAKAMQMLVELEQNSIQNMINSSNNLNTNK